MERGRGTQKGNKILISVPFYLKETFPLKKKKKKVNNQSNSSKTQKPFFRIKKDSKTDQIEFLCPCSSSRKFPYQLNTHTHTPTLPLIILTCIL